MSKLLFYVTTSLTTILTLYLIHKVTDYSIKENPIRDHTPKTLRSMLSTNSILTKLVKNKTETIIIGTSHVLMGFDSCSNDSIKLIGQSVMTAKSSINIAESLIYEVNDLSLILEVTLIRSERHLKKTTTIVSQYVHRGAQGILNLVANVFRRNNDSCNSPENVDNKNVDYLKTSRMETKRFDWEEVNNLFSQYQKLLNNLVNVCDNSTNPKITLVSLPIHPDLLAIPEIQTAFQQLETNMLNYLKTIHEEHSCNISYLNLTSLGAEFPEQKYWKDPGHFFPEVGDRVLDKIDLLYTDKN